MAVKGTVQLKMPADEMMEEREIPRPIIGRLHLAYRCCCDLFGVVGLALIAGLAGGASMGVLAVKMMNIMQPFQVDSKEQQIACKMAGFGCLISQQMGCISLGLAFLWAVQVYKLVIRKKGLEAREEALAYAAPVAVIGTTIIGAILILISEKLILYLYYYPFALLFFQLTLGCLVCMSTVYIFPGLGVCFVYYYLVSMMAVMFVVSFPTGSFLHECKARIFLGMLLTHTRVAFYGYLFFLNFVSDGTGKACLSTVATGAVLEVLALVSPNLGPAGTLGALLGVSGSAGVALYAAGAVGERYGGAVGRVTAALGAAAGAYLPLTSQDAGFGIILALFAAGISVIPNYRCTGSTTEGSQRESVPRYPVWLP